MENKVRIFSEYSYIESSINSKLAGNAAIIQKVRTVKSMLLSLLEKAAIDPDLFQILSRYFNLNNERPKEIPNEQQVRYLYILSCRLIKLLNIQSSLPKEQLLLRLFILLNFNKDQIIEYYISKIDSQVEGDPAKRDDILQFYLIESRYLPKKNISYTSDNHSLRKIIRNHITILQSQFERQSEHIIYDNRNSYRYVPRLINITGTSSLLMYALNMLVNTGMLKVHLPFKSAFEILSQLIRGTNGRKFTPNTLRSRFNTYSAETLQKMADCLEILKEYNDYQLKMIYKRK